MEGVLVRSNPTRMLADRNKELQMARDRIADEAKSNSVCPRSLCFRVDVVLQSRSQNLEKMLSDARASADKALCKIKPGSNGLGPE